MEGLSDFVPEGRHDRSQVRSAWDTFQKATPVPEGRLIARIGPTASRGFFALHEGVIYGSSRRCYYSESNDLAAKMPDKLKEMQALFLTEAAKYQVLPLDNSVLPRIVAPRPSAVAGKTVFTYTGENVGIPVGNAPSILDKDFTITAEVTIPEGGGSGMIVTMGGRFGGYGLYLLRGRPVFDYNFLALEQFRWEGGVGAEDWLGSALKPGKHTIVFDFKYDGPGPAKGGTGVLSVDGKEYARKTIPHTIPFLMSIDKSFDIGSDTRTPVDDSYQLPFHFTGTIDKLTFNLGRSQLTADDQKKPAWPNSMTMSVW